MDTTQTFGGWLSNEWGTLTGALSNPVGTVAAAAAGAMTDPATVNSIASSVVDATGLPTASTFLSSVLPSTSTLFTGGAGIIVMLVLVLLILGKIETV